jgi:soluble P-type ATPase
LRQTHRPLARYFPHASPPARLRCTVADTFGTAKRIAEAIDASYLRIQSGNDKHFYVESLGAPRFRRARNGRNATLLLRVAALGIAVIGLPGAHRDALAAADVVAASIENALSLPLEPKTLSATLRL